MKHTAYLLLSLMILSVVSSCGGQESIDTDQLIDESVSGTNTENTEAAEDVISCSLPDDLSFENEVIKIMYREQMEREFTASADGDSVDAAVYARNLAVEERFNVKLEYLPNPSQDWNGGYQRMVSQSVMANDYAYDIVSGPSYHMPTLILQNCLLDLDNVEYLDFDKPWWSQGLKETTAIGGKIFLVSGDISLGMLRYIHCLFYNKSLAEAYDITGLEELVLDGGWTLDKAIEYATLCEQDLNGDGTRVLKDDLFGFIITNNLLMRGFIDSLEMDWFHIDDTGNPAFNFDDIRTYDACEKMSAMMANYKNAIILGEGNESVYPVFTEDRALFVTGRFIDAETAYRDMESDFGFMPFPKWDESQEEYKVTICGSESTFAIPVNSRNPDMMGAVMEALAYESYIQVSPVYYESALKVKYSRASENIESKVIDIIRSGAVFNPTVQLSKIMGISMDNLTMEACLGNKDWASTIASNEKMLTSALEKIMSEMGEIE